MAKAGKKIATCPFHLVAGCNWRGTAKRRADVPRIVDWYMDGEIPIDPMITNQVLRTTELSQHPVENRGKPRLLRS